METVKDSVLVSSIFLLSEEVDVDEIHVIQCSLKDSLLQRSGQIHGPLEYSVQSWHVHLVGKSVQD